MNTWGDEVPSQQADGKGCGLREVCALSSLDFIRVHPDEHDFRLPLVPNTISTLDLTPARHKL